MGKLIVSPLGGCGTTKMFHTLHASLRPDGLFGTGPCHLWTGLDDIITEAMHCAKRSPEDIERNHRPFPRMTRGKDYYGRCGVRLLVGETYETNLLNLIEKTSDKWIGFFGCCSSVDPFLTRNKVKALCFVRHPRDSYWSFCNNQHPEFVEHFEGGLQNPDAARFYAKYWNNIVSDFISSGNIISRYEYFPEDTFDVELIAHFKDCWKKNNPHRNKLDKETEKVLHDAVSDNFYKLYDSWEDEPCPVTVENAAASEADGAAGKKENKEVLCES